MVRIYSYNEIMKQRNELIWEMGKQYSSEQVALIFKLTTEQVNSILYTMRELKGSWSK